MIDSIHRSTGHSIRLICSVLDLPRSSYYHAARPTPSQSRDYTLEAVIEDTFMSTAAAMATGASVRTSMTAV